MADEAGQRAAEFDLPTAGRGKVRKVWRQFQVPGHVAEVLTAARALDAA